VVENDLSGMVKVSFDKDQISAIKRALFNDRRCADRISLSFAVRFLNVKTVLKEDHFVLGEIDYLEGIGPQLKTKREEQFRHPPLLPFWHKHYSVPRHLLKNVDIRWNLTGGGNRDLLPMLRDVAEKHGEEQDRWQGIAAHRLVVDGYKDRAERGLTGDWIIFAKHAGRNYYLDLATHEEGRASQQLYEKIRQASGAEFPFLFE
jgi:hypothetical protein